MICWCKSVCCSGIEERKGAACKFVIVPHPGGAHFEFLQDLRMDLRHIFQRLFDAVMMEERAPALRILRPGVTGKDHAPPGLPSVIRIIKVADGQVGHRAAAKDAFIFLPEATFALEEDLGRGIVMQLADGALLGARETA